MSERPHFGRKQLELLTRVLGSSRYPLRYNLKVVADLGDRGAGGAISGVTSASVGFAPTAGADLHGSAETNGSRAAEAAKAEASSLLLSASAAGPAELLG